MLVIYFQITTIHHPNLLSNKASVITVHQVITTATEAARPINAFAQAPAPWVRNGWFMLVSVETHWRRLWKGQ
jgi:hypothetical protein